MALLIAVIGPMLALIGVVITLLVQRSNEKRKHSSELDRARNEGQVDLASEVIESWQAQVTGLREEIRANREAARDEVMSLRAELRGTQSELRESRAEHRECQLELVKVQSRVAELENRPVPPTGTEMTELARSLTLFAEAAARSTA